MAGAHFARPAGRGTATPAVRKNTQQENYLVVTYRNAEDRNPGQT